MMKLLTSASLATLLAVTAANAQTTSPSPAPAERPAGVQVTPPVTPENAPTKADKPAGTEKPSGSSAAAPAAKSDMPSSTAAAKPAGSLKTIKLSDAEAKTWIDKVVYSSDNKNVGEVAAFKRDADGTVQELHADVGGFLGIGETRVRLMPHQFTLQGDRVTLNMTSEEIKSLPKIEK